MEGAQWVGRSTVTGVHFGPCAWSGLCLLGVRSGFTKCGPNSGYDNLSFLLQKALSVTFVTLLQYCLILVAYLFP